MERQQAAKAAIDGRPKTSLNPLSSIKGSIVVSLLVANVSIGVAGACGLSAALRVEDGIAGAIVQPDAMIARIRAVSAAFNAAQVTVADGLVLPGKNTRDPLDPQSKDPTLTPSLDADLTYLVDHAHPDLAAKAAARVAKAVRTWQTLRGSLGSTQSAAEAWRSLAHQALVAEQQLQLLLDYTTAEVAAQRRDFEAQSSWALLTALAGIGLTIVFCIATSWFLARRILRPLGQAVQTAGRLTRGHLETPVTIGRFAETAMLESAMESVRVALRGAAKGEAAQRRSAQSALGDALESSREGVVLIDPDGKIALANAQAKTFLSGTVQSLKVGEGAQAMLSALWAALGEVAPKTSDLPATRELRLGEQRWLRLSQSATRDGGVIIMLNDISVFKEQEQALTATNQRFDVALANMSQGLCLYDAQHRLQVFNRRFCEIFRLPQGRIAPGMSLSEVITAMGAVGNFITRTDQRTADAEALVLRRERTVDILDLSDDRMVALAHQPLAEGGWVETYEDVTDRLQSEAKVVYMARHDALTGLPNRLLFSEKVEAAVASAGRGEEFAVLCLGLDHFKHVNDALGHPIGDALLRAAGDRLSACIREVDTVARLGGDEFAIVQVGLKGPDDATILARRIVQTIQEPFDIEGHRLVIGVSIGIAMGPGDGSAFGTLLKNADVALHKAKADGRETWRFFELEMDARLQARRALELDLRETLVSGGFELYYQPLFDFKRNQIGSFEALVRWNHPTRGMISPAEFIPIAEEIGLISQLGEWVLKRACLEAKQWPDDIRVAVNVSPAQFRTDNLAALVETALSASRLDASRLELEITESVILANTGSTMDVLSHIRGLGVKIAMDDFGTGYSSLSYLRSFPFDKVKIDQSFTRDLDTKSDSSVIIGAIIGLCKSLGMRVAAEGVETQAQLDFLFWEGCSEAQGYYFSRPVPAERVPGLIKKWAGGAELFETPEQRLLAS